MTRTPPRTADLPPGAARPRTPARRAIGRTLAAVLVAGVAVAGCAGDRVTEQKVMRWHAGTDDGTSLTLVVAIGLSDRIERARVVSESASTVVVAVDVRRAEGDEQAIAVYAEATVALDDPIGERVVENVDGTPIQQGMAP